jgi:hypothetical protein
MASRPALPRPLDRDVKVEAGHRCAIPTCRQHPIEVAHIEPRKPDGSNDVFDNLIALCANCHTRYDKGEIDRLAMRQYKTNLSVLNNRYGDLEQRVLQAFAVNPSATTIMLPGGLDLLVMYLLGDELLTKTGRDSGIIMSGVPSGVEYAITSKGRDFIARWLQAKDLEET